MNYSPSRLLVVLLMLASFCVSCSKKDSPRKIEDTPKAAEQGKAPAQVNLSNANSKGESKKDNPPKIEDARKASEQGDAEAQYNLGVAYANGAGVAKDQVEAVKWYRKAAEQGNPNAETMLGFAYFFGLGVAKNAVEGYAWINLAAVNRKVAMEQREEIERSMTAQQITDGQKRSVELNALIEANKSKK